jgi:c-di-GMP-binding flagellar brake protein YcgR
MPEQIDQQQGPLDGQQALELACARNAPVEVFLADAGPTDPPARGRMLELREGGLVIEKVQIIGRRVGFTAGTLIDAYFTYNNAIFHFRTRVVSSAGVVQLNRQKVVVSLTLAPPQRVEPGQRRGVYRVPFAARAQIPVHIWELDAEDPSMEAGPSSPPPESQPAGEAHYTGMLVDASDTGLGVVLSDVAHTRFKVFQRLQVRFALPDDPEPMCFTCEVRHTREVHEGAARLGLLFDTTPRECSASQVRRLVGYLVEVQRTRRRG